MVATSRGNRRKVITREGGRRKGDIEKIKIEGERDKEQEVIVHTKAAPPKKSKLSVDLA